MESELQSKIIGQDEAVTKLKAIRRNRVGLKDQTNPWDLYFLVLRVGKTQLAKELAKEMLILQIHLFELTGEYMEKFAVTRLVGSPPGYVGYEEGGQLTEKVRKTYSIITCE